MKTIGWILIGCIVLALNNVLLLSLVGYFERDNTEPNNPYSQPLVGKSSRPNVDAAGKSAADSAKALNRSEDIAVLDETTNINNFDDESSLVTAIRKFSLSDEFVEIMDEYQLSAGQRFQEMEKRLQGLSAEELMSIYESSNKRSERQFALQTLLQSKVQSLDDFSLRRLYELVDEGDSWGKPTLLAMLIQRGDKESLIEAKQQITSGQLGRYRLYSILESVYDQDPDFIKDYMEDIRIGDSEVVPPISNLIHRDAELKRLFLDNNLDDLLEKNNPDFFATFGHVGEYTLTDNQEDRIVDLFAEKVSAKRNFALSMVTNIQSVDKLQRAFASLDREQDKFSFLSQLITNGQSEEQRQFAKELAAESDDVRLQTLLDQ